MTDALAYSAGFLAMISFVPQLLRTIRTKSAADISVTMLLLTLATNVLYFIYGLILSLYPIVIMIGLMTCVVSLQLVLTLKYRLPRPTEEPFTPRL